MRKRQRMVLWMLVLVMVAGCRHAVTVVDSSPKPPRPDGTISGRVATPSGEPVASRAVHVLNNETGARFEVTTAANGGFTLKVPPGRYHVDVQLLDGEKVVDPPADLEVGKADIDANLTVTIAPTATR